MVAIPGSAPSHPKSTVLYLCKTCESLCEQGLGQYGFPSLLLESATTSPSKPLRENYQEFLRSARSCPFCKLMVSSLRRENNQFDQEYARLSQYLDQSQRSYDDMGISEIGKSKPKRSTFALFVTRTSENRAMVRAVTSYKEEKIEAKAQFLVFKPLDHALTIGVSFDAPLDPRLDEEAKISFLSQWLTDERALETYTTALRSTLRNTLPFMKHLWCRELSLPTRLIFIPAPDSNCPQQLHLVESSSVFHSEQIQIEYVTLSHRWGLLQSFITTKENLLNHNRGFQLADLPQTYRDAVVITQRLGFQYLWIDAICIVQNDDDDWDKEASRMGDVYSNAVFTIAAHSSPTDEEGFLKEALNRPRSTFVSDGKVPSLGLWISQLPNFDSDVNGSPLSRRGWVLQERLLSSRIIHFTAGFVYCESRQGTKSEHGTDAKNPPDGKKPPLANPTLGNGDGYLDESSALKRRARTSLADLNLVAGRHSLPSRFADVLDEAAKEASNEDNRPDENEDSEMRSVPGSSQWDMREKASEHIIKTLESTKEKEKSQSSSDPVGRRKGVASIFNFSNPKNWNWGLDERKRKIPSIPSDQLNLKRTAKEPTTEYHDSPKPFKVRSNSDLELSSLSLSSDPFNSKRTTKELKTKHKKSPNPFKMRSNSSSSDSTDADFGMALAYYRDSNPLVRRSPFSAKRSKKPALDDVKPTLEKVQVELKSKRKRTVARKADEKAKLLAAGAPLRFGLSDLPGIIKLFDGRSSISLPPYSPEDWHRVIEFYSTTSLTHGKDKLVAISGLAKQIQQTVSLPYFSGLWADRLHTQMLWFRGGPCLIRPEDSRAPSWSWASVDGEILYPANIEGASMDLSRNIANTSTDWSCIVEDVVAAERDTTCSKSTKLSLNVMMCDLSISGFLISGDEELGTGPYRDSRLRSFNLMTFRRNVLAMRLRQLRRLETVGLVVWDDVTLDGDKFLEELLTMLPGLCCALLARSGTGKNTVYFALFLLPASSKGDCFRRVACGQVRPSFLTKEAGWERKRVTIV